MRTKSLIERLRSLAVLLAVLTLSGCIMVPARAPVRQFAEPTISFLVPGTTNQSHAKRLLGPPVVRTTNNAQWIYYERGMSREYYLFVGRSPSRADPTAVEYFLFLDFDDAGVLTDYKIERNGSGCGDGICVARGMYYSIEADEDPDEQVDEDSRYQCTVYMFTDKPRIGAWIGGDSVETSINDELIGYLLDEDTYFRVKVDGGTHEVQSRYITNAYGASRLPKQIRNEATLSSQRQNIECKSDETYFFEHVTDRKTGTTLVRHDAEVGAKEIAKRNPLRRLIYSPSVSDPDKPAR